MIQNRKTYTIYDDKCTYLYYACVLYIYTWLYLHYSNLFFHVCISQFADCGDLWRPCNMIVVLLLLSFLILPDMKAFVVLSGCLLCLSVPFCAFQSQIRKGARDLRNSVNVDIIPTAAQLRHFVDCRSDQSIPKYTKVTKAWSFVNACFSLSSLSLGWCLTRKGSKD